MLFHAVFALTRCCTKGRPPGASWHMMELLTRPALLICKGAHCRILTPCCCDAAPDKNCALRPSCCLFCRVDCVCVHGRGVELLNCAGVCIVGFYLGWCVSSSVGSSMRSGMSAHCVHTIASHAGFGGCQRTVPIPNHLFYLGILFTGLTLVVLLHSGNFIKIKKYITYASFCTLKQKKKKIAQPGHFPFRKGYAALWFLPASGNPKDGTCCVAFLIPPCSRDPKTARNCETAGLCCCFEPFCFLPALRTPDGWGHIPPRVVAFFTPSCSRNSETVVYLIPPGSRDPKTAGVMQRATCKHGQVETEHCLSALLINGIPNVSKCWGKCQLD